jgi:DNA-binding CsgD family transcriptional regulator
MLSTLTAAQPAVPPNPLSPRPSLTVVGQPLRQTPVPVGADLAMLVLRSLEHVGRGMLLVAEGGRVLHANRLALQALVSHPLVLANGLLLAREAADAKRLEAALQAGLRRGLRHLLQLGSGEQSVTLAVLPIEAGGGSAVLLSLEQASRGQDMAVQWYARQNSLSVAETGVLEALLGGQSPADIASSKGVALSTVRTQIGQLRLKTGSRSIRQLLDRVGGLPPMMQLVQ